MQASPSCPLVPFGQAHHAPSDFSRYKRVRDSDPPARQMPNTEDARAAGLLATIANTSSSENRVHFSDTQSATVSVSTAGDSLTDVEPPNKRTRCIADSDAVLPRCTERPSNHYAALGTAAAAAAGQNREPRLLAVDCAMRLRSADGALMILRGTLQAFVVTRALAPLVQSETHDGALAVDASLEGLLPVVTFLSLRGNGADNWQQVAQSVVSFAALSSAATTAARCRLQKLADRLLRWRLLASQWTCPAARFTIKVVRATSADTLVVTAHAAAVAIDGFVELTQHVGQVEAERFALDSITARRRDIAQRTVALPLARFEAAVLHDEKQHHDGSDRGDTASAGDNKAKLSLSGSLYWLATWRAYIDTTRRSANGTGLVIATGMLGRARVAVASAVSTPAARAELTAALDCYERLCADGTCQPDNAFHLYAVLTNHAAGWTCAAAGFVIFDAVARSLATLGLLLDAEAKFAPSTHRERKSRDHREHIGRVYDTAAPTPTSSRMRIERHMADLFLARLGGSFQCDHDVGMLIDEALRKHYGIS